MCQSDNAPYLISSVQGQIILLIKGNSMRQGGGGGKFRQSTGKIWAE